MSFDLRGEVSKRCARVESFGTVVNAICGKRGMNQKKLAKTIVRSPAEVSRMMHNQLPKNMTFTDIHAISSLLECTTEELVELVNAFICHKLYYNGLIDPDIF